MLHYYGNEASAMQMVLKNKPNQEQPPSLLPPKHAPQSGTRNKMKSHRRLGVECRCQSNQKLLGSPRWSTLQLRSLQLFATGVEAAPALGLLLAQRQHRYLRLQTPRNSDSTASMCSQTFPIHLLGKHPL